MADAPRDKGGDKPRVYDPINAPDTFFKGDPASNAELVRRALEAQSRSAAMVGMPGEDLLAEVRQEKSERMGPLDTHNRTYSPSDRAEILKAMGQKIHAHLTPDDEETAAKKSVIQDKAKEVASRKLGNVRLTDAPGAVTHASQTNTIGRGEIIRDQSNMGVTEDDIRETMTGLDMK